MREGKMQEKVHFTPPTVQIFEGKPPPTSWFNENIVRFFQVKSEHEFLSDFVTFLQGASADKLAKAKQEGKLVLEFAFAPDEGSTDDIAKASTFNLLQTHVGTQILFLSKLVQIAKEGNPRQAKALDDAQEQLNEIVASFPKLSQEQVKTLENLMAKLLEMAKKLPPSSKKEFWEELNNMLEKMYTNNSSSLQLFQSEMEKAKNRMEELGKLKEEMTTMLKLFSSGKMQQGLSQFIAVLKGYKKLPPDMKEILGSALSKAGKMSGKNVSLPQLLADAQLSQWIQKMGGKPTREQLVDYIQRQMKEPPFNSMSPPFMADFLGALHKNVDHPEFPANASSLGPAYEDTEALPKEVDSFTFDQGEPEKALEEVHVYFSGKQQEYENRVGGMEEAARQGAAVGENVGKSAAWGAAQGSFWGSLPNQFQKAIINHYMPQQEKYLMELAELLMFDNMGASIGNSLLNIITDFSAAATNFDFSNFLHGDGKGEFSGTPTQAQNQISKETSNAYKDKQEINNAINKIDSEIKNIENNKNLTASQKQDMISKLQGIKANLQVALGQVTDLYNLLKQLHVHPGSDSKHFKITGPSGWEKSLSQDENLVINGDPKSKPPGGLVQIASDVNTFQQTYSDQGQNQQMMLQMRMTEIQQEWTVVSTALQLLNQMYMNVAQGIYK